MTRRLLVLTLSIALAAPLQAAGGPVVGQTRVLADLGGYTSCAFAADGSAVICSRVNEQEISEELWRVELESGQAELIGHGRHPAVRGSLLAYMGTEPGREGIWLRDLEGNEPERCITNSPGYEWPTIAGDGKTVACSRADDRRGGIYVFGPEGAENGWLCNRGEGQPVYSADGSRMLMVRGKQVWVINDVGPREDIAAQRVTDGGREKLDPSWGPGDSWITFIGRWNERNSNIGIVHLPSGKLAWLAEALTAARSPIVSPRGDKLAYIAAHGDDNAVYVADLRLP